MNRRFTMRYTMEERLEIGRQIYNDEITKTDATERFGISRSCAREYMRLYRDVNKLPHKDKKDENTPVHASTKVVAENLEELEAMTKEQLIQEVVKARITEARLKKGYEVKGDGSVIRYGNKNTR